MARKQMSDADAVIHDKIVEMFHGDVQRIKDEVF